MMKEVDADENGSIEFPEFLKMMASRHRKVDNTCQRTIYQYKQIAAQDVESL